MKLSTLGRNHALVRRVRSLRRERSLREREGVFLAEGSNLADEALRARADVERVLVSPRLGQRVGGPELLRRLLDAGWDLHEVADSVLEGLQDARTPQPVLTIVRRDAATLADTLNALANRQGPALLVAAHGLQDPGNLGALLRTADAAGSDALLTCGAGADPFHPRAVRASAGSIFRLPVHHADVDDLLERFAAAGVTTVAAVPQDGSDYSRASVGEAIALFIGGEGAGLPPSVRERVDRTVHIPMRTSVNSLSVGAAAAVLLFDIARRRQRPPD